MMKNRFLYSTLVLALLAAGAATATKSVHAATVPVTVGQSTDKTTTPSNDKNGLANHASNASSSTSSAGTTSSATSASSTTNRSSSGSTSSPSAATGSSTASNDASSNSKSAGSSATSSASSSSSAKSSSSSSNQSSASNAKSKSSNSTNNTSKASSTPSKPSAYRRALNRNRRFLASINRAKARLAIAKTRHGKRYERLALARDYNYAFNSYRQLIKATKSNSRAYHDAKAALNLAKAAGNRKNQRFFKRLVTIYYNCFKAEKALRRTLNEF